MIQPHEMKLNLPMELSNKVLSTTSDVWSILVASKNGELDKIKELVDKCPELIYAQYNYTPPIHFAVREGHQDIVQYLLNHGAHDPAYRIYPFNDNLITIAEDRGHDAIATQLKEYDRKPELHKYKGDNGEIHYNRTELQQAFEKSVDKGDIKRTETLLKEYPEFAKDDTYFWSEGILLMPAKQYNRGMMELLMSYGARVPGILKWTQFYYFERYDSAVFLMEKGMNPNVMSWHHVSILHDMAQKADIPKAELLIKYGADINTIEEEYQSTPLGLAARWGNNAMVEFLLSHGADPNKSGAAWSTPLAWARKKGHADIENILVKAGAQ